MNQKTSLAIPISSLALLDFIVSEFRLEVMLWTIDSFIRNHHNGTVWIARFLTSAFSAFFFFFSAREQ